MQMWTHVDQLRHLTSSPAFLDTVGPMQVSMERTIGTVCGGLLGLGISLLGHGFGQDSDMLFTGQSLFPVAHCWTLHTGSEQQFVPLSWAVEYHPLSALQGSGVP